MFKRRDGSNAQLFSFDLMLALVPLTIALGMSANAMSGIIASQQDYLSDFGMNREAIDMASVTSKNPDVGLAADIDAMGDVEGSTIIKQKWVPPPIYAPPPVGPTPMIFIYINTTEWWVPFKRDAVSKISMVDGRNVLDVATMSRNRNLTTVNISGVDVNLLNTTKMSILSGKRPFRIAVVPIRNVTAEIDLASMSGVWPYNYSMVDVDGDGEVENGEGVSILPYAESGNVSENIFAVQIPVLSMFDESSSLSRYNSFKDDVYEIPVFTDSTGTGMVFVLLDNPETINKTPQSGSGNTSFDLKKTGLPMGVVGVTLGRKHPYTGASDSGVLNGTISVYVNTIQVFNGTLSSTENRSVTETFVSELNPGANVIKITVRESKPDADGLIFLTIQGSDMWVSQRIFMMPAYLNVLVSGGGV